MPTRSHVIDEKCTVCNEDIHLVSVCLGVFFRRVVVFLMVKGKGGDGFLFVLETQKVASD